MIEITDLYCAIKKVLEETFEEIPVRIKDFKIPNPPCFYVKYVTGVETQTAREFYNNDCSFEIVYFAENENVSELLEIEQILKNIFKKPLKIVLNENDKTVNQWQEVDSVSISLNEEDYVLNCMLSMQLHQQLVKDDDPAEINRYDEVENEEFIEEIEI